MAPKTAQDPPKTGPRSSWIGFFRLDFSLRFLIVLGSILERLGLPNGAPGGRLSYANRPWAGLRRSQGRLGSVLFSSCRSGSLFWSSWDRFGDVLRRSSSRFGASGVIFGALGACFRVPEAVRFNPSTHRFNPSTHQLINPSTHRVNPSTHQTRRFNPSTRQLISSTH